MIYGYNKTIATFPFEKFSIESTVKSGFATINQKTTLTALLVVAGNREGDIQAGSVVYVNSDQCKQVWANKVYKLGEQDIILVPEDAVVLVKTEDYSYDGEWTSISPCGKCGTSI
jgi:hypothetical protein